MLLMFLPRMRDRMFVAMIDEVNINNAIEYYTSIYRLFTGDSKGYQICTPSTSKL